MADLREIFGKPQNLSARPASSSGQPSDDVAGVHGRLVEAGRLRASGNLAGAQQALERLVGHSPNYFGAWSLLGSVAFARGDVQAAMHAFHRCCMLNGKDLTSRLNLARCYQDLGALDLAADILRGAVALEPNRVEVHTALGRQSALRRDHAAARAHFARARELNGASAEIVHSLGENLEHLGESELALQCFVDAYRLQTAASPASPIRAQLLYFIARSPQGPEAIDLLEECKAIEAVGGISTRTALRLGFVKSLALDAQRKFDEAWAALGAANREVWTSRAAKEWAARREGNVRALERARGLGQIPSGAMHAAGPVTIFILGPSRAGKSQLESLLARSVVGVTRAFERAFVREAVRRTAAENSIPEVSDLDRLPRELSGAFRTVLAATIGEAVGAGTILTATNPGANTVVDRIAEADSRAVFVFVSRDTDDNSLRCLQTLYDGPHPYAYDLDACREHLRWHEAMAEAWSRALPGRTLRIRYEDMVATSEATVAKVAELAGTKIAAAVPRPSDDRNCAAPYRRFLQAAQA